MENQARFDLNAAFESWRLELAAQAGMGPDAQRELETHVRDTVTELKRTGLNDEESFWLARRRVGHVNEVVGEFAKTDGTRSVRELLLWFALFCLGLHLWGCLFHGLWATIVSRIVFPNQPSFWISVVGYPLLNYLPPILLAVFVVQGSLPVNRAFLHIRNSRRRFFLLAFSATLLAGTFDLWAEVSYAAYVSKSFYAMFGLGKIYPALLIALICWLLPTNESKRALLAA